MEVRADARADGRDMEGGGVSASEKVPWIERVRAADAEAEQTFANMKGFEALADHEDSPVVAAYALIAIAAELRAQRIARRPGAGQTWGPSHPSYEEMGQ